QRQALDETADLLKKSLESDGIKRIFLLHQSHEEFPPIYPVKLIAYNLGYLPKGDKSITTLTSVTLKSVARALDHICEGGAVSIVCYPGHVEGAVEEKSLVAFAEQLSPERFTVFYHQHINRKSSPSFLWIVKKSQTR
ncbi:MAG TPA: class I SAM-dependent methyltransferase, partial [Rhabdochlamydiaceae bacterium]